MDCDIRVARHGSAAWVCSLGCTEQCATKGSQRKSLLRLERKVERSGTVWSACEIASVGQPKYPGDHSASLAQARKLIPLYDGVRGAASADVGSHSVFLEGCERRR